MVYENSPAHNYAVEFDHPYHVINKTENPDVSYGTSVGGTVKYTDGTAATGLTVQMVYADGKVKETVTTDATGKFSFTYVEIGDYTIKVTDVNGNSASSKISVKRMNDTDVFVEGDVELKLEKSYSISGTVSEGNSKVTVTDENGNVIVSVTTDANGNFTIDNLPNGSYVITAETENGSVTQEITVHNGTVTDITLEIPAESATIWGYVEIEDRDKGHNRRKWIQVTLYNQDGVAVAQCKSNSQGEYRFENVPLGNYSIVAETAEMRPDKKHGFDRNHALKGYAYVTVEAVGLIQAETIVLYEENDHLATVAGKVTAQGEAQISEVILRDVFYNEIARCTTTNNGKYVFKNVRDGMYFVTAITESYGMSFAVVVVRDGKVYGNTDIFVKKSDKIKDREDKFKNDIPELKDRNEAANYRDRIAEEKRHYDALSDKEKKQLSKEYVDRLNKYLEWLSNVTYNAVTDNENEKVTVENGGLALSGDNIENKEEITFTINVTKTDGHTASTDGIKNEQDFIHHSMQDTAGEKEIKQYYEISMTKTSGDEETKITNVYKDTGAKGKFRITMDIPEEYRGYKHYNMLHVHNGEVVTLADLDDDPNTITFEVDRFSTFALTATDETLSVEGADLKFSGASLTLQDNLAINYKVKKSLFEENGYSDPYVKFVLNGKETVVSEYRVDGDKYIFDFTDIAPYQMNDTIYATLYANFGNTLNESETREYSVAEYCYNMLNKYSADAYAEFRTLLVDLLNYGAETQTYQSYRTDALVNASLTETQKAWGTAEDPTLESVMNKEYATIENPTVTWKGAGLNLRDSITLRFKLYAENIQNLTVKITTEDGEKWTIKSREFEKTEDNYYVYFDCLSAAQMSEAVYVTVYNGDVAVSNTICYSIESYAYTKQNDEDENLSKLVKAMMKYGNSACVYYELINQ
ncbi:MAG: carboxypeptidase regulatory-like domain-containing protein [Oscillospiraceae bacterium]|nr:carboxypeptidase regulatory-like domain-containing protein [Oscillospiraceae bacterium]